MELPEHVAAAVATVRAFAAASGAERVVLIVDQGEDRSPVMVDGDAFGAVQITEGADVTDLAPTTPPGAPPRQLPELRPPPPTALALDPDTGELEAPLGVVANLASGVLALATAFGGRSVASVDFPSRDPELPITIAAREGDPFVVAAGDRRFELPAEALG
jgi:hypothetical protein